MSKLRRAGSYVFASEPGERMRSSALLLCYAPQADPNAQASLIDESSAVPGMHVVALSSACEAEEHFPERRKYRQPVQRLDAASGTKRRVAQLDISIELRLGHKPIPVDVDVIEYGREV